jgi:hypothetical protein
MFSRGNAKPREPARYSSLAPHKALSHLVRQNVGTGLGDSVYPRKGTPPLAGSGKTFVARWNFNGPHI